MKVIPHTIRKLLPSALGLALAGTGFSASIIDSAAFFEPADLRARLPGATSGILTVQPNNLTPHSVTGEGDYTSWQHTARGLIQTRANVSLGPVNLGTIDVQVAGYTETTGNSLVFGRQITAEASVLDVPLVDDALEAAITNAAGSSGILYSWDSTVTATLPEPLEVGQQYRVSFTVTTGTGLSVGLLDSANFGISSDGITGTSEHDNAQLLNLLDILQFGGSRTGVFTFDFTSEEALESLDFFFSATDTAGLRLLGGQEGNEDVLTFSNFQVTAIPEPSSLVISGIGAGLLLFRRRRVA